MFSRVELSELLLELLEPLLPELLEPFELLFPESLPEMEESVFAPATPSAGKAVGLLEVVDGFLRQTAEIAGHRAVVIAQRLEILLEGAHSVRTNAVLEQTV